jgi:hypothetical protein
MHRFNDAPCPPFTRHGASIMLQNMSPLTATGRATRRSRVGTQASDSTTTRTTRPTPSGRSEGLLWARQI